MTLLEGGRVHPLSMSNLVCNMHGQHDKQLGGSRVLIKLRLEAAVTFYLQ